MSKQDDDYREALNAVLDDSYLKAKTKILQKHLEALNNYPYSGINDPEQHALFLKLKSVAKIEAEIQRRKDSHWASFHDYKKGIIIGLIAGVGGGIVVFYLLQNARKQEYQDNLKKQPPSQISANKPIISPAPSSSPANTANSQTNQKRK